MSTSMNWKDPETKSKLLLSILATQEEGALSGAKASKIAEYMGCTAKAVTHQLTALRKELAEFKSADGSPATPVRTKKRKSKKDDSEDGSASPTKKSKPTPKKKSAKSAKKVEEPEEASDGEDNVAARKDKAEGKEDEGMNGVDNEDSD